MKRKPRRPFLRFFVLLLALVASLLAWAFLVRPGMEQVEAHRYPDPTPAQLAAPALSATWFGTTGVLLSDGEHAVMIDPFFTRPPGFLNLIANQEIAPDEALIKRWLDRAGIKKLDAVLVSHSHYDHAMDAGIVARLTGAPLLGSTSTAYIGRGSGLPVMQLRVIKPGQAVQYGPFTITFIRSKHAGATGGTPVGDIDEPLVPPARYLDYKQGGTYSILIEHPLGTVLHHGSAGYVEGALAGRKADVVFLGIAIRGNMQNYLREVVDAVGATRVIPTHWDDFTLPLDEPLQPFPVGIRLNAFFDDMAQLRPGIKVLTLQPGRRVVLFPG
jgi:L-ascorbate metabolism protein UlaG (beta-lactamase superfamily)